MLAVSATLGPFAACSVEVNDGGGEAGATRQEDGVGERWDLRTGRDIDPSLVSTANWCARCASSRREAHRPRSARWRDLADRYGLDGSRLGGSGDEASTGSEDVVPGGPSLAVGTRLRSGGDAVVAFTIVWPRDGSEPQTDGAGDGPTPTDT